MITRKFKIGVAAVSIGVLPIYLEAKPYEQLFAFGDSLTDTGQYPDLGSPTVTINGNPTPTAGLRLTNRTGPTFLPTELTGEIAIEKVARELGLGEINPSSAILPGALTGTFQGTNFARAGAQSAAILASITDESGASVSVSPTTTRQRNGYLVDSPKANPGALYYINGGANDIIYRTVTSAQGAANSAQNIADGFNALYEAGAKYIMVANVPHLGSTPLAFALGQMDATAPAGLTQLSQALNQSLYQQINQSDANIVTLDIAGLLEYIRSNPSKYGFTSTNTCFDNSRSGSLCQLDPAHGISSATPNPDLLIFNDDVHPTTAAQSLIADYTLSVLQAPADISMLPVFGLNMVYSDLRQQQAAAMATQSLQPFGDWQGSATVTKYDHALSNPVYDHRYSGHSEVFSIAGQKRMNPNWRVGANLSLSQAAFANLHLGSNTNIENTSATAFMLFNDGRYHSSGSISLTKMRFADIYRHSPLGIVQDHLDTADTKGDAISAYLTTSYDISFDGGNWQYGPALDLFKSRITVDEYKESSTSITALNVDKQSWDSTKMNLSLFAQYLSEDKTISFTAKTGLLREYGTDQQTVGLSLQSLDVKSGRLPGYQFESKTDIATQANLTYSPTALSRISLIYNSLSGQNSEKSLSLGITYHL